MVCLMALILAFVVTANAQNQTPISNSSTGGQQVQTKNQAGTLATDSKTLTAAQSTQKTTSQAEHKLSVKLADKTVEFIHDGKSFWVLVGKSKQEIKTGWESKQTGLTLVKATSTNQGKFVSLEFTDKAKKKYLSTYNVETQEVKAVTT